MRREDREIKDLDTIENVVQKCDVCRISLFDEKYPYIVPLNYGYKRIRDNFYFYFHCAAKGTKLDLLKKNNHVSFELDCSHTLHVSEDACNSTMEFESVCGNGRLIVVGKDEKTLGLTTIMQKYSPDTEFTFNEKMIDHTTVLRLDVRNISGKRLQLS